MPRASESITVLLERARERLAEQIVARQYALEAEIWARYGEAGRQKGIQDVKDHLTFLIAAVKADDPSLFRDYVNWIKVVFAGLNFPAQVMRTTLACARAEFHATLPPEISAALDEYLNAGLAQMEQPAALPNSYLQDAQPGGALAQVYLQALLRGERQRASQMILSAVQQGMPIKEIYLQVFQPCQYEIGRLWMTNRVTVAQEHYCTAATQLIMSQLYPWIFATPKHGRRLIATCVGGELHEIGMRMVADFFELDGWDTYYLGANAPALSIVQTLQERQPDILAISATMPFHQGAVRDLIAAVRATSTGRALKILVGGYAVLRKPTLWQELGADGSARDAQEALTVANGLFGGPAAC